MFRIRKPEHLNAAMRDMARLLGLRNRDVVRLMVASGVDTDEQRVSGWFRGQRRMSPDTMIAMANAMEVDIIAVPRGIHIGEHIPVPEPIGLGVFRRES